MENIEQLKSSRCSEEDQLEMMLLMQMEKLPAELLEQQAYGHDPADTSMMMDFSGGSGGSSSSSPTSNHNTTMANLFHDNINNVQLHPSLLNPPISSTTPLPTSGTTCDGAAGVMMNNWRYGPSGTAAVPNSSSSSQLNHLQNHNSMAAMREMIFRIAAMQPIYIDPESVKPPKRRNVKISKDPQSVAARHRRERISERIRILQRLVPGGTKMDTASMLDEAIHYVKFLKTQVQSLERAAVNRPPAAMAAGVGFPVAMNTSTVEGYGGGNNNFPLGMKKRHHNHSLLVPGGFHHHQQQHFSSDA